MLAPSGWNAHDGEIGTDPRPGLASSRRRPRGLLAIAFVVAIASGACGGGDGTTTLSPEPQAGRDIYRSRCASCHGRSGGGGMGPQLSNGRVVERYPDIADHIAIVRDGRRLMPSWEGTLTADEIEAVVRYERQDL